MKVSFAVPLLLTCLIFNAEGRKHSHRTGENDRSVADVLTGFIFHSKCMGELGCFYNGPPFFDLKERTISLLPSDREKIRTRFGMYTQRNQNVSINFTNLKRDPKQLLNSTFKPEKAIKFIVPGFMSKWAPAWELPMKDALLDRDDFNIFIVDWTGGDGPFYEQAVANTRVVGAEIALFIEFLKNITHIEEESVHIIGHSLGAHIAGYAGKRLKHLGRITGLDPAGPCFENVDAVVRLDKADALLVDNIHTNGAKSRFTGFGTTESIGHLDYFPNGGRSQPGCPSLGTATWTFVKDPSIDSKGWMQIQCSHHRAVELFHSSIKGNKCDMLGFLCQSWDAFLDGDCDSCDSNPPLCYVMGYQADESWVGNNYAAGNVYLNTTDSEPFCADVEFKMKRKAMITFFGIPVF